ncbi:J domain-containing protein [Pseudomonas entomophila]|uniref:J domain-containing protein n=1 Tax=Pseudomonas entomophila TaxID=312306 RepID=UPI0015E2BC34|nr:J domain-containing protein [Pseudomonas entomophila]MBA1190966.1 J domain-containing protein [Pseudomonas entomophila]
MSCWALLGIAPIDDTQAIRLAYRTRLPAFHPETDPQGFQALREAYEQAMRLAREQAQATTAEPAAIEAEGEVEATPEVDAVSDPQRQRDDAFQAFETLLDTPHTRFDLDAWQAYVASLDDLPLDALDDLGWDILALLQDCGPISHQCAGLLAQRFAWAHQLLRLDAPDEADAFLQRLATPDPFDTRLMRDWPAPAQMETFWYLRTLAYCYDQRPFHEYRDFAGRHTCLPLPDDDALMLRLRTQFCQAGVPARAWRDELQTQWHATPDDLDLLYLLARQHEALLDDEQALGCWSTLWRTHRHPEAPAALLALCSRHAPQRLPLLIQALDGFELPDHWPSDLADPAQGWASPAQRPETLTRWLIASRLPLEGIAATFTDWCLNGDDELPLLAWLLDERPDATLQRRYWHAWALQRGEADLLRQVVDEPDGVDEFDALIVEGLRAQARQTLRWLQHAPIPQALVTFCASEETTLPPALLTDEAHPACREWLRRLRHYSPRALDCLLEHFQTGRMLPRPSGLWAQYRLMLEGFRLPPADATHDLTAWYGQCVFTLALLEQPGRWLRLVSRGCVERLAFPPTHFLASLPMDHLRPVDTTELETQLLERLDLNDTAQRLLASRLITWGYCFDSPRLPSMAQLFECADQDSSWLEAHPLGCLLLSAAFLHDAGLSDEQRGKAHGQMEFLKQAHAALEPLFEQLLKGRGGHVSARLLEGVDATLYNTALEAFGNLAGHGRVPSLRVLKALQCGKDDPEQDAGVRCAILALLAWSERLLEQQAQQPSAPAWAVWRLDTRLTRTGLAAHLASGLLLVPPQSQGVAMIVVGLLVMSGLLRRLRDVGQGVPALIILLALLRWIPILPLLLLGWPGDPLPNRNGPPPGQADSLTHGLQAALRRLNAQ